MVGIAQLVSAPDCGSGGPGFESLYPPVFPWEAVPGAFLFCWGSCCVNRFYVNGWECCSMNLIVIIVIAVIIISVISSSYENEKKKEAVRKIALEKEREYKEWYEKLKKSTLFNEIVTKLFSKGYPYELHFGHRNVNYTYDENWDEYKQRTYSRLESDEALKAFVDLILEKYPSKYRKQIEYELDGEGDETNQIQSICLIGTWSLPVSESIDPWA